MYLKYFRQKRGSLDEKIEIREDKTYNFSFKNQKFILAGKFYYFNLPSDKNIPLSVGQTKKIESLLKKNTLEDFINSVEGEYWGLKIDYSGNSIKIFSDKLKQLDLYYFIDERFFIMSSDPKNIINEVGQPPYDNNSLISAISFYLPRGNTLFEGIKRLKYNEFIKLTTKDVTVERFRDKNVNIEDYGKDDLLAYEKIVEKSILSRASDKLNLVFNSGGWDSTLILALLRNNLGANKVKGVTMKIVFEDGRCFNEYEVKKVQQIAKIFGTKVDIVEINYKKDDLYSFLNKEKDNLFYRGLFFLGPANWSKTISYIKEKYGEDVTVFHGEGCDSLHNFGFSQFETLLHESEPFRIYADKMHNYLFSPSFFKKVKDNSYPEDNVYRIFRGLWRDKKFVDGAKLNNQAKIYQYLLSFLLSDIRIPFRELSGLYVKPQPFRKFQKWLKQEYFQLAIDNVSEKNLYYHFASLYADFHLQSPQIKIYRTGLKNVRFPYIDLNLFNFLYRMPENFGRGLEFRPTKFPEKELARKVFPQKLIDILEAGPHSYLSEVEKMNPYDEYWLKGKVYDYVKHKISESKISRIFDKDIFQTESIEKFAQALKRGHLKNLSSLDTKLLIMLSVLSLHPDA